MTGCAGVAMKNPGFPYQHTFHHSVVLRWEHIVKQFVDFTVLKKHTLKKNGKPNHNMHFSAPGVSEGWHC